MNEANKMAEHDEFSIHGAFRGRLDMPIMST